MPTSHFGRPARHIRPSDAKLVESNAKNSHASPTAVSSEKAGVIAQPPPKPRSPPTSPPPPPPPPQSPEVSILNGENGLQGEDDFIFVGHITGSG
ncbi:unnamed protein product [Protopolystoma xenopodis]|uniref:Uncharacterized protein n=1 Tax=Protopolystoma xenopodis TaxID=117903 RepID=A0A3S4ZPE9_9PLAT|nr:unnamed protein product [Protopolystoma xenopodis]